ncbi:MAG: serine protease [Rhodospirillales bacterium]|nr:serine protease [Rhodospirillales bacterium]MDP6772695.1 serine protease [Rhodospirillales bacterium]
MKAFKLFLCGMVLVLAGCADAAPPPPVTLTYPYAIEEGARFEGHRRLAERVAGSYVRVLVYADSTDEGIAIVNGASGAIVDARGYVVTPAHIAKNSRFKARVTTMDGRERPATIVHVAPGRELALLRIDPFPGMQVARLADSGIMPAGWPVVSIGTPNNRKGVVTVGIVANPRRGLRIEYGEYGYDNAIELRMEVEPGHSGGPVFDVQGRLIGMVASFGLGDTRLVPYVSTMNAYAVPAAAIAAFVEEVRP